MMERSISELNLRDLKVVGSLPTIYYIPSFIDQSEETNLLQQIDQAPVSKWKSLKNRRLQNWGGVVHEKGLLPQKLPVWLKKITGRICDQTSLFPSPINHVLINEYLPDQGIMPHQDGAAYYPVVAILSLKSPVVLNFTPHQKLKEAANTTRSNTHEDIARERDSFDGHVGEIDNEASIVLMPRSLLIFKDDAYSDYLHGIVDSNVHRIDKAVNLQSTLKELDEASILRSESREEAGAMKSILRTDTRISLTCRLVLKVHTKIFKF